MRLESETSATQTRPIDVYLGFEIFEQENDTFAALPQDWANEHPTVLEADDLPTLRKRIWRWWHNLHD